MPSDRTFTLFDLVAILIVLGVGLAVVCSGLSSLPRRRGPMPALGLYREVHTGMLLWSQNNGAYFPGLDASGTPIDLSVEARLKALLDASYLPPANLISPSETDRQIRACRRGVAFTRKHYSLALLQVPDTGGRRAEWRDTTNTRALILADRNTGTDAGSNVRSVWTATPGDWRGVGIFNDNSASFLTWPRVDTKYGETDTADDNVFERLGDGDAYLVRTGNDQTGL